MGQFISTERHDAVALVTVDNPPMNALSSALLAELLAEIDRLDHDPDVRVIVLRGGGERAFVAGADIKEFPTLRETGEGGPAEGLHAIGHRLDSAATPSIAAIQGYCLGGGLELAMCCDIRICTEDAKLGQPEIKLGLIPGGGGTQRLPRLVGNGRAMYLNLTGEFIDAETALDWGLVERVVAGADLVAEALKVAATIAAQSPHALAVIRRMALETRDLALVDGLAAEADAFLQCIRHPDGVEGVAAFIEKRAPVWTRPS